MTPEYRYTLRRELQAPPVLFPKRILFCALNPSTATETEDDPTVRRMIGFAKRFGASEMRLVNLFAARTTNPLKLWLFDDPVGPENDLWTEREAMQADVIVAAWGATGKAPERAGAVLEILRRHGNVHRLGDPTRGGMPRHPLYLPGDTELEIHAG